LDADNTESCGEPGVTSLAQDTLPAEVHGSGGVSCEDVHAKEDVDSSSNNFAPPPM
jgi:hypothetical protein